MAIKISSILNVWKGSSSKKSKSSSSNKSSSSSTNKSSSSTKSSGVKATSTKPVSKASSSGKSTSVKSTSKSNTSTASKTNRSTASPKTTSSTTYLKDASKLYNSSGVAYSYGRPAESYVMENKLKAKTTSNKSTVAKKKEVKPQATQVPVAKKKTTAKKVYEPVDSRSAKGKYGNKNKAAEEGASLAMSCVPIVGDGKDILEAVKGRDLITNKKLSGTERVITVAAAALPIIPAAPARKAVRKVATEPKVVKAVKNETKKLAKSSGDLVKKAKKALGVSGKKSAGVVEDVAKKTKSTVVSSGKKVGSQLEDVNKKAVQKGKDNARIEVENSKDVKKAGPYSNLTDSKYVGEGKKFTLSQKRKILQQNMEQNGGVIKSDMSGEVLISPTQSKKGITPSPFEAQIDHINPKSKGGTNSFTNAQVLSRRENIKKSNK